MKVEFDAEKTLADDAARDEVRTLMNIGERAGTDGAARGRRVVAGVARGCWLSTGAEVVLPAMSLAVLMASKVRSRGAGGALIVLEHELDDSDVEMEGGSRFGRLAAVRCIGIPWVQGSRGCD